MPRRRAHDFPDARLGSRLVVLPHSKTRKHASLHIMSGKVRREHDVVVTQELCVCVLGKTLANEGLWVVCCEEKRRVRDARAYPATVVSALISSPVSRDQRQSCQPPSTAKHADTPGLNRPMYAPANA